MGTRVHPGENSWEDYLSCHGGSSNAFTDSEHTCFYFEVNRAYLQEALERFASFFTCPLFAASATRREINAVDSEFRDGFNSDSERLSELVNYTASLVHPTHPFGKWGWGNKDSLDTHLRAAAAKAKPAVKGKPTPSKVAAAAKASGTAIDLRTSLKAFHARWYSAHAMKLVVYDAAGDAAEIAQWIESGYSAIKNNGLPLQDFSKEGNPFEAPAGSRSAEAANGAGAASAKSKKSSKAASAAAPSPSPSPAAPLNCYGKIYHVVPIKDTYKLSLSWVLPPMQAHFRVKPTHYAEHLIGHEGSGSLFSLLRDEGWVTSLCAGVSEGGNSKNTALDLMQISITLTKLGAASVPRVLDACFQYLSLIRQPANIRESIWLELQSLSALAFLFAESPDPSEFVQEAAMNLQVMPAEEVLRGQFLHERFDRELTTLVLNTLRVDNCRIDLLSANTKALAASMQRPLLKAAWFHTSYFEEMLTTEIMEAWAKYDREPQAIDKRLHLPKPNEFIPTDFEIRVEPAPAATAAAAAAAAASSSAAAPVLPSQPARAVRPTRICPSLRGEYWHNLDSEFTLPRAHVHLLLSSPVVYASAANVALTELLLKVLVDFLSEYAYAASLAELEFSVESLRSGVEFKFAGFSHRIADFVRRVVGALGEGPQGLEAFLATDDAATRFEGLREKTHRHFRHQYYQPAKQVEHLRLMLLQQHKFPIEDITDAAKQCTMQQLVAHLRAIRLNLRIIGLVDGNLLRSEGEAMFSSIEASILPDAAVTPPLRDELTLRLPVGHALYVESRARNARESNSAVEAYWALAPSRVDLKSALSVLESLLHEPAFDHLRSKLQLGYKVYTGVRNTHGILGFVCGIQSADFKCDRLNQEIHRFMFEVFYPYLLRLSEEKYLAAREALIAELLYADSALIERVDREWEEITENRSYCWQRSSVLAAQVATVTLAQVTQLFEHYLLGIRAEPPQLATVGVTTSSSTGAKDEAASMTDVESASLARETSNDAVNAVAQLALSVEEKQAAKPAPATSSKRSSRKGGAASAAAASPSPPPLDPALEALVTSRVQAALHAPVVHRRHLVVACFGHPRKGRNQREEEEDEEEEEDDEVRDATAARRRAQRLGQNRSRSLSSAVLVCVCVVCAGCGWLVRRGWQRRLRLRRWLVRWRRQRHGRRPR